MTLIVQLHRCRRLWDRWGLVFLAVCSTTRAAGSQERESTPTERRIAEVCLTVAQRLAVSTPEGACDLHPEPALRWSKNTREEVYGNVYVWTRQGVPVAVASIFQFAHPKDDLTAEFQSLSATAVTVRVGDATLWTAPPKGVEFRPAPNAPAPGTGVAVRGAQMRSIARRFEGQARRDANNIRLRVLPREVFAYRSDEQKIAAGGIIA
jgi:hypothetical protein